MKIILSIIMASLLMVSLASAVCRVEVKPGDAVTEYTYTKQVPLMETIQVEKQVMDYTAMKLRAENTNLAVQEALKYNEQVRINNTLLAKRKLPLLTKVEVPKIDSSPIYKTITESKQVQRTQEVSKFKFTKTFPFVERYTIQVKLYTTQEFTEAKIKEGINLDEATGEFYEMREKC